MPKAGLADDTSMRECDGAYPYPRVRVARNPPSHSSPIRPLLIAKERHCDYPSSSPRSSPSLPPRHSCLICTSPTSDLAHPRNIHARRHHCTRNAHPAPAGVLQERTGLGSAISRFAVVFPPPPIPSYDTCTFLLGSHTTAFLTMPRGGRDESGGRRCTRRE
jgi:hypothetical protein